jgi:hypothetical protein
MENPDQSYTRYAIGKKVPNDPISIRNDLHTLVKINWVTEYKIQHLSKYAVNLDNEVVGPLIRCLREIGYIK